jgi:homoserine O-acetyltransferase
MYQWNASGDFDASAGLGRIRASVLAINSADDERNPPQTGLMTKAMLQIRQGQLYVIPASAETRGHGTTGMARFWKARLQSFLARVPVTNANGR